MVHVGETGTKRQQTRFRCLRFASSRSAALGGWEHSKVKLFAAPRPLPTTPTWPAIETLHVEKKHPLIRVTWKHNNGTQHLKPGWPCQKLRHSNEAHGSMQASSENKLIKLWFLSARLIDLFDLVMGAFPNSLKQKVSQKFWHTTDPQLARKKAPNSHGSHGSHDSQWCTIWS